MNALEEAQRALEEATERESHARTELDAANAKSAAAEAAFVTSGADKDLEKSTRATMSAKRAATLHARALEALSTSRTHRAALAREADIAAHDREVIELPKALANELVAPIATTIELDVHLDGILLEVTRIVIEAEARWEAADARARSLGRQWPMRRPTVEDAIRELAIAVTKARESEGRETASDLVSPPLGHGDWRISPGLSARQVAEQLQHTARASAETERASLLVQGANLAAAQLASQEAVTTNDEGE